MLPTGQCRWPERVVLETTTAGEDEPSEGNPGNSIGDAVDVASPVPVPEDKAAAAAAEPDVLPHIFPGLIIAVYFVAYNVE